MTEKTLPERMREAADVLEDVVDRRYPMSTGDDSISFSPATLRTFAARFEREDAEKAAATARIDAEAEELAEAIVNSTLTPWQWRGIGESKRNYYLDRARDLIAAGWRKQDPT